jgi:CLN3 protein
MAVGYFIILPSRIKSIGNYESLPTSTDDDTIIRSDVVQHFPHSIIYSIKRTTRRIQPLVIPYMAPLFLVYVSEYTINQVGPYDQ